MIESMPSARTPLIVLATSLPLCALMAVASWHLLEKPCLSLKRRVFRSAEATPATDGVRAADAR